MATVFFSYSHKDEDLRDRLETALSTMKRQGLIESWHDRRLKAGDEFDRSIRAELERADAAPRDGRPVRSWPDLDEAFLDVVKAVRAALPQATPPKPATNAVVGSPFVAVGPRSSNLGVRRMFTEADRDRFRDEAFDFMARFFEGSLDELCRRNPDIESAFKRIDATRFTAVVYRSGNAVSRCSVVLGGMFAQGISYSANDRAEVGSSNENLLVESDDHGLFLKSLGLQHYARNDGRKLTCEGAAELYWELFLRPLQSRR